MKRLSNFILFVSFLCAINVTVQAQTNREESDLESNYTKREVMIPMRDGIKLYTAIYEPKNNDKHHPILMHRSPYSCEPYGNEFDRSLSTHLSTYVQKNYIIKIIFFVILFPPKIKIASSYKQDEA